MIRPRRIGMLTPSSNTVLEPVTARMLSGLGDAATVHYSRLRVTEIALEPGSDGQFGEAPMTAAAELLADARVELIVWNGTSGSWLGLEKDARLCEAIAAATGIAAVTSAMAMKAAYEALGVRRLALVTPYTQDVNDRIAERYAADGIEVVRSLGCGIRVNEQFANVPQATIAAMLAEALEGSRPDAVAVVCTNMNAARLAREAERRYGVPALDSVTATAWHALRTLGIDSSPLAAEWGRVLAL